MKQTLSLSWLGFTFFYQKLSSWGSEFFPQKIVFKLNSRRQLADDPCSLSLFLCTNRNNFLSSELSKPHFKLNKCYRHDVQSWNRWVPSRMYPFYIFSETFRQLRNAADDECSPHTKRSSRSWRYERQRIFECEMFLGNFEGFLKKQKVSHSFNLSIHRISEQIERKSCRCFKPSNGWAFSRLIHTFPFSTELEASVVDDKPCRE